MVTWLLHSYADAYELSDKDAEFQAASQSEDGETEREFYRRLMDLYGYLWIHPQPELCEVSLFAGPLVAGSSWCSRLRCRAPYGS